MNRKYASLAARLFGAMLTGPVVAAPGAPAPISADRLFSGHTQDLRLLSARAYVWGIPLVEAARIRARFLASGGKLNAFLHRHALAGPEMRTGVGPNNDTIYSLAWVDLAHGPLVVTLPDFGDRYYTLSINEADSSAQFSPGQRTHGGQLPPLFLYRASSRTRVPKGMLGIPVSTRYANLAGRILVKGQDDLPVVHALQDRMMIRVWHPAKREPSPEVTGVTTPPSGFLHELDGVLKSWWPRNQDEAAMIRSVARLVALSGQKAEDERAMSESRDIAAGLDDGRAMVARRALSLGEQHDGWTTNYRGPRFGNDWLLRAAVARDQIFVAVPEEAVYPVGRLDSRGEPLTGTHRYRIRFPGHASPPVGAFWSITAYDDRGYMMVNPINRYSIGDRTKGLVRDPDGGVSIELGHAAPSDGYTANWLPVNEGVFYLMMRLYIPQALVLNKSWRPPPIERIK